MEWSEAGAVGQVRFLSRIWRLIADLKEKTSELELRWKNEKEILSGIKTLNKEIDSLKIET